MVICCAVLYCHTVLFCVYICVFDGTGNTKTIPFRLECNECLKLYYSYFSSMLLVFSCCSEIFED